MQDKQYFKRQCKNLKLHPQESKGSDQIPRQVSVSSVQIFKPQSDCHDLELELFDDNNSDHEDDDELLTNNLNDQMRESELNNLDDVKFFDLDLIPYNMKKQQSQPQSFLYKKKSGIANQNQTISTIHRQMSINHSVERFLQEDGHSILNNPNLINISSIQKQVNYLLSSESVLQTKTEVTQNTTQEEKCQPFYQNIHLNDKNQMQESLQNKLTDSTLQPSDKSTFSFTPKFYKPPVQKKHSQVEILNMNKQSINSLNPGISNNNGKVKSVNSIQTQNRAKSSKPYK